MNKISLIFFGTPDIALNSFVSLINDLDFEVKALVTQPPRPNSRGNKIIYSKLHLEAINKIPIFTPEKISKEQSIIEMLKKFQPDFFVTFAFGQILNQEVLDIPKYGTINLHASLLPKYRGANPISECLLNGDKKTGITTMLTELSLDTGDICMTEEISLDENTNYKNLVEKISNISPELIKKTLKGLYNSTIKPVKQDNSQATYTKKTEKKDKLLDFNNSVYEIHNKIRAYLECNTTHFTFGGKIIKVLKSSIKEHSKENISGIILNIDKNGIEIGCKKGSILIETVKPEGKNEMSAYNWSLGSKIKTGDKI